MQEVMDTRVFHGSGSPCVMAQPCTSNIYCTWFSCEGHWSSQSASRAWKLAVPMPTRTITQHIHTPRQLVHTPLTNSLRIHRKQEIRRNTITCGTHESRRQTADVIQYCMVQELGRIPRGPRSRTTSSASRGDNNTADTVVREQRPTECQRRVLQHTGKFWVTGGGNGTMRVG